MNNWEKGDYNKNKKYKLSLHDFIHKELIINKLGKYQSSISDCFGVLNPGGLVNWTQIYNNNAKKLMIELLNYWTVGFKLTKRKVHNN